MICYVLFGFSVIVSLTNRGGATAAYKPTDVFLFNCGATSDTNDTAGRTWTAENPKMFSSNAVNASFSSSAPYQESGVPLVPYTKARIFRSDSTYSFPISPGWKFLRLYFYPTRYESGFDAVDSFFAVSVNGFTLLKNFSADLTVKASKTESIIKEFIVPVKHTLNLTFTPSPNSLAFVNGIEIVSMPDRFYSKGGFDDVITNIGSDVDVYLENSTVFETVYRVNVGGQMVGDVSDSGMFRRWLSDEEFRLGNSGIEPYVPDIKINYTQKTPAYVAPEDVYATSRTMGNAEYPNLNLNFNLTWLFEVDPGFNYLVRLHFCETLREEVNNAGQRFFSIFVDKQMATLEMDVFRLSGGSWIPMYLDYFVIVGSGNGSRHDLRLDLHPLKEAQPKYYDAILNGVEILKLNPDGNLIGPNPNPLESTDPIKGKSHVVVIIIIVAGSVLGLVIFIEVIMLSIRKIKRQNRKNNSVVMFKGQLKHYTYAELKKITKSFSQTVGKGEFGTVYGGNICSSRKVAVKVLKNTNGNEEDFINEVASMSQTSHVNIVSLLGFCYEGSKRAIVYEFLENGSLDQYLISRDKSLTQDVTTLYGIMLGIARGLEYLHYGCTTRIVHFDIKPQNILLDENLCPKVADFGLAKICEKRESIMSLIDTRGTIGYIAPEVFSRMYGQISHKSDVYSYGMLILEMIRASNEEMVETNASNASSAYFLDWIYKDLETGKQTWIHCDETRDKKEITRKIILVALWCIQPYPSDRPPMNIVVEMMEGSVDALEVPPKPSMHIST